MKLGEALYCNILTLLNRLGEDSVVDPLLEDLSEEDVESVYDCVEQLQVKTTKLQTAFNNKQICDWDPEILHFINRLLNFPTLIAPLRIREAYLLGGIVGEFSNSISATGQDPDFEQEVPVDLFCIEEIQESINPNQYVFKHPEPSRMKDSIAYFSLENETVIDTFIGKVSPHTDLILNLAHHIGQAANPLTGKRYILLNIALKDKPKLIFSTLCMHLAFDGEEIYSPIQYGAKITPLWKQYLITGKQYSQFLDIVDILDEYNFQNGTIEKFLRLYHVLENFMTRSIIVSLERVNPGTFFSIRDFKRLYAGISDNEQSTLKRLVLRILESNDPLQPTPQKFLPYIKNQWSIFLSGVPDSAQLVAAISKIGVWKKTDSAQYSFSELGAIREVDFSDFFSRIIYATRNSIVHNKETEFHLTSRAMANHPLVGNAIHILLEKFLIPQMEFLVTYLVTIENDIVWYSNDHIKLYESS